MTTRTHRPPRRRAPHAPALALLPPGLALALLLAAAGGSPARAVPDPRPLPAAAAAERGPAAVLDGRVTPVSAEVARDENGDFTLSVTNTGTLPARRVTLLLDDGRDGNAVGSADGRCVSRGAALSPADLWCDLGDLAPRETAVVRVHAYMDHCVWADPSAAGPQTARPSATDPQAAGPSAAGPSAAGPQSSGPQAADPQTIHPGTTGPRTTEPQTAEPRTTEPQTAEPQAAGPQSTAPRTTEPQTAEPRTTEPQAAGPRAAGPRVPAAAFRWRLAYGDGDGGTARVVDGPTPRWSCAADGGGTDLGTAEGGARP